MKKKIKKNHISKINTIQKIRAKNNKNWMGLLKIAFESNPKQTKEIIKKIFLADEKINKVVKQLLKD